METGVLKVLCLDFSGTVKPESIDGKHILLLGMCRDIKKVFAVPLVYKSQLPETINSIVENVRATYSLDLSERLIEWVRMDNEPTNTSKAVDQVLRQLRIGTAPIVPHNSEQAGSIERLMRTMFDAIKCNIRNVDHKLWSYCSQYCADVWDRIPHTYANMPEYNGMTPIEILESRVGRNSTKNADMLKRFGCLCYFRDQGPKTKLHSQWRRGVHLGLCPKSTACKIATWTKDIRGIDRWTEYSTIDVKFRKNILIDDVESLRDKAKGIPLYVPLNFYFSLPYKLRW